MKVEPRRPLFHKKQTPNLYRIFLWIVLIAVGYWLISQLEFGAITNPFEATPTPTRTVQSYAMEGAALFTAGELESAILAYKEAVEVDPFNAAIWTELARIQTYSTATLTTDQQRLSRLQEARDSIEQAVELAPDDSLVHAIHAFVLDWSATAVSGEDSAAFLIEAEQAIARARLLDSQNTLALAFYAEILNDQQKWTQAVQVIEQAVAQDPTIMDVHRVYGLILESTGQYSQAIEEYNRALQINPNLTFLHISIGQNYRTLALKSGNEQIANALYEDALEYFARAARLNEQLDINDPKPYIAIAKTYTQQGEFFAAARNVLKALELDPSNANTYGELGVVYQKSRNFEGAIPALRCAIRGCTAAEAYEVRQEVGDPNIAVTGLPLTPNTATYYLIYGNLLAAFSPRDATNCDEAEAVLNQLLAAYGDDPVVAFNANDGLAICASVRKTSSQTPMPVSTPTLLPTPKP